MLYLEDFIMLAIVLVFLLQCQRTTKKSKQVHSLPLHLLNSPLKFLPILLVKSNHYNNAHLSLDAVGKKSLLHKINAYTPIAPAQKTVCICCQAGFFQSHPDSLEKGVDR